MNEPNLVKKKSFTEKIIDKQKSILIVAVVLIITLFAGTSYSLLTNFDVSNNAIIIKDGDMRMTLNNTNGLIYLKDKSPEKDEIGFQNANPVVLTVSNTGNYNIMKYEIMLNKDKNTTLDEKYIRYSYSTDLGVHYSEPKNFENGNIIYTGYNLANNKAKTIYLKIWIDEKAGSEGINKNYYGKINVKLYEKTTVPYAVLKAIDTEGELGGIKKVNDNEYRYLDANANNYVKFNYELWRIIGVFKDGYEYLRIVKDEVLNGEILPEKYNSIVDNNKITYNLSFQNDGLVYWNNGNIGNNFSDTGLRYYLNTSNDEEGNRGYLGYLANTSKSMIKNQGDYKVGLLKQSDIQGEWYKNLQKTSWLMETNENGVLNFNENNIETIPFTSVSYVRPVVDLIPNVVILNGDGTKDNPYELGI